MSAYPTGNLAVQGRIEERSRMNAPIRFYQDREFDTHGFLGEVRIVALRLR